MLIFIFSLSLQGEKIFWLRRGGAEEACACMEPSGTWMLSGTIHLHLIKFSLLLPGTSAVTAPAHTKGAGIFCSGRRNAAVPAQLRSRDAQERSMCLQPGVSNASFYRVGDFGGDFDLLCNTAKCNQIDSLRTLSFLVSRYRAALSDVPTLLTEC